jgi:hypothetical protein
MTDTRVLSDELLRTIGTIVVYHAEVEHWIDAMVYALYIHLPGAKRFSKRYPVNFAAELEFLLDCFTKLPSMKPLRSQGVRLLGAVKKVSEDRSHIVHGYMRHWERKSKRLAFVRVWKPPGGLAQLVTFSLSEKALIADAKRVQTLRLKVYKFATRVGKICMPEDKEPLRSLGG